MHLGFFFWLVGWVFFWLFCFVRYKYTSSFHRLVMKCQDKNCFVGLINVEDRGTVCEKGVKPPYCGMSDFTTRSLTCCLGN